MTEPEYNPLEWNIKALRAMDPPLSGYVADIVEAMAQGDEGKLTRKLYRALAGYVESQAQDPRLPAPMPESAIRTAVQGLALGVLPVEVNPCIDTLVEFLMNLQRAAIPGAPRAATPEERAKDPFNQQGKKQPWAR
jgi:hypothetical protein